MGKAEKCILKFDDGIDSFRVTVNRDWVDGNRITKGRMPCARSDRELFILAVNYPVRSGAETEDKRLGENLRRLSSLQEHLLKESAAIEKEIPVRVFFEDYSFEDEDPLFEVFCGNDLYSNGLPYSEAENTVYCLVKGMVMAVRPEKTNGCNIAENYVVTKKSYGFDGMDCATLFTGKNAYEDAVSYLKHIWKDYLDEEIRAGSRLDSDVSVCDDDFATVVWLDGTHTDFSLLPIGKPLEDFVGGR